MKYLIWLTLSLVSSICVAAPEYTIRVLHPDANALSARVKSNQSQGQRITEIFGPIAEIRIETVGINHTEIDTDDRKIEAAIRKRIANAKCLDEATQANWHMAPWAEGFILLKSGRILPIKLLLSGILVGDLLFSD